MYEMGQHLTWFVFSFEDQFKNYICIMFNMRKNYYSVSFPNKSWKKDKKFAKIGV
jgi:hypothetical protein